MRVTTTWGDRVKFSSSWIQCRSLFFVGVRNHYLCTMSVPEEYQFYSAGRSHHILWNKRAFHTLLLTFWQILSSYISEQLENYICRVLVLLSVFVYSMEPDLMLPLSPRKAVKKCLQTLSCRLTTWKRCQWSYDSTWRVQVTWAQRAYVL